MIPLSRQNRKGTASHRIIGGNPFQQLLALKRKRNSLSTHIMRSHKSLQTIILIQLQYVLSFSWMI